MKKTTIFRISFVNQGEIYEIFAKGASQGGLFGFVEVEDLVFGERTKIVIDSSEERLKTEFEGVQRTYIPMHAILRCPSRIRYRMPSRVPEKLSATIPGVTSLRLFTIMMGKPCFPRSRM